jgi:hypothetical protein
VLRAIRAISGVTFIQIAPVVSNAHAIKFKPAALHLFHSGCSFVPPLRPILVLMLHFGYMSMGGLTTVTSTQRTRP